MSPEQFAKNISPKKIECKTFIEAEGQYPKICFIFVPTIDKDNVETVEFLHNLMHWQNYLVTTVLWRNSISFVMGQPKNYLFGLNAIY